MKNKLKALLPIIIVVLFGTIAGFSLLHPGLPPTHDGEYHIVRFFLFNEAISDGNLYPRWADHLNNGFGVPLFNFVYPLPNYVASLFHLFKFSFIDSFKLEMFTAIIIGGIFFYLWSKEFWGRLGGVVSSIFYTFSPYHFVDIYIRGSVGEVWALGFFPAFLWAYTRFVKSGRKSFLILSSVFLALIIFSHNILALMFFIFSLSYIVFLICMEKDKKYLIRNAIYVVLLGLGLSAIFWFPAIIEIKYVVGLQIFDVSSYFPQLYQLLIPTWGSGFSGGDLGNELSYQIGAANLMAIFLSLIVMALQLKRKNNKLPYVIFFFGCLILIFFLMLDISLSIWKIIPFMGYFQFPWRLLSLEIIFTSFLAGSIFSLKINSKLFNLFIAAILIFMVFILSIGYAKPAYYMNRDDNYYTTRSNFIDGTNSIGNVFNTVYLKSIPAKEKNKAKFIKGSGKIKVEQVKSNSYMLTVIANENSEIQANLAYFPGWNVYVNGKNEPLKSTRDGRFIFLVPKGNDKIEIIFKDTLARRIAVFISLVSLGVVGALLISTRFVTIKK